MPITLQEDWVRHTTDLLEHALNLQDLPRYEDRGVETNVWTYQPLALRQTRGRPNS